MNEPVFRRSDYAVFAALTVLNLGLVGYALFYWFSQQSLTEQTLAFLLLTVPVVIGLGMYESRWLALPFMRRPRPMEAGAGWKVGVATTFVPGAEPIEMLEETLAALVAMDYPHDTWVLDEGDDDEVKMLCERLGARHFSRKRYAQYQTDQGRFQKRTKHGNYNAWLYEFGFDAYDLIVAFDPDHVPERRFLLRTLGYFDDARIGYVQAAQVYYNQPASFIARGAAEETYAYYSSIQMSSYAFGYPIVTGCHNVHRVTALREVGGFAPHDADDLLITILYRAADWRGVYLPEKLALGLTPVDWAGYLRQQRRWARSVLDVKFRLFPRLARRLPRLERLISLVHGLYYLHGLSTGLAVGLLAYMLASGDTPPVFALSTVPVLALLFVVLTACSFWRQRYFLDRRGEWGLHWRSSILRFAKWPYVLLALVDALFPRKGRYAITPKVRSAHKTYVLALPHLAVVATIAAAWAIGTLRGVVDNTALDLSAAAVIAFSLAVVLTELKRFPDPYDPALARRRLWPPEARGLARAELGTLPTAAPAHPSHGPAQRRVAQ